MSAIRLSGEEHVRALGVLLTASGETPRRPVDLNPSEPESTKHLERFAGIVLAIQRHEIGERLCPARLDRPAPQKKGVVKPRLAHVGGRLEQAERSGDEVLDGVAEPPPPTAPRVRIPHARTIRGQTVSEGLR